MWDKQCLCGTKWDTFIWGSSQMTFLNATFCQLYIKNDKKSCHVKVFIYIHSILCDFIVTSAAALSLGLGRNAARKLLHM